MTTRLNKCPVYYEIVFTNLQMNNVSHIPLIAFDNQTMNLTVNYNVNNVYSSTSMYPTPMNWTFYFNTYLWGYDNPPKPVSSKFNIFVEKNCQYATLTSSKTDETFFFRINTDPLYGKITM